MKPLKAEKDFVGMPDLIEPVILIQIISLEQMILQVKVQIGLQETEQLVLHILMVCSEAV